MAFVRSYDGDKIACGGAGKLGIQAIFGTILSQSTHLQLFSMKTA